MNADDPANDLQTSVAPLELVRYLHAAGWQEVRRIADGAGAIWRTLTPAGRKQEILVPLDSTYDDFADRMRETLNTLAGVEGRPLAVILTDLATTTADVIRIRVRRPDTSDGSIPLEDGVHLLQHAQDLMLAAACAAVAPRRYFQTRKPTQAVEYLRQGVRLGQTERGSFVLTILALVPPALEAPVQTTLFADSLDPLEPFERKVTRTLAMGVVATRRAAEEATISGKLAPFAAAIAQGVSANLCDALAGLGSTTPDSLVDLDFTWARSRPLIGELPGHVKFSGEMVPVMREASRLLRETSAAEDYELYGVVTRLERSEPGDGRVTVTTIREDPPRQVTVTLSEREYGIALEAHREGVAVTCFGTLRKDGRRFVLDSPYRFQISPLE